MVIREVKELKDGLTNERLNELLPDCASFFNAVIGIKNGRLIWHSGQWLSNKMPNMEIREAVIGNHYVIPKPPC